MKTQTVAPVATPFITPAPVAGQDAMEGIIADHWSGWQGDSALVLENGQIWQQAEYKYDYRYKYRPKVWICYIDGAYKALVDGHDKLVAVKRLR